jgi:hypothetical protein
VTEEASGCKKPVTRFLTFVGLFVTVLGGSSGLLFALKPSLKPCLGGDEASFTGAPVFPRVDFREHLVRTGVRREEAAQEPRLLGAEVRFSYQTSGFRGRELPVTWSLVVIERDGTLGPVVRGQDRALATNIEPTSCSEIGGTDLFVQIPNAGKRYRVVLELYRDQRLDDRLGLTQTVIFRG